MKLIDKTAVVAEIENLENTYKKCPTRNSYEEGLKEGRLIGYKDALHKINTLEVKEVNFGKEFDKYLEDNGMYVSSDDGCVNRYNGDPVESEGDYYRVAKHFFELGLKASNQQTG